MIATTRNGLRSTTALLRRGAGRRGMLALVVAGLLGATAGSLHLSTAAFTAQKANPNNSFTASTYFGFFASGFYAGDAADNRAITGIGFRPDIVIVKGNVDEEAIIRTSTMSGDAAKPMGAATALTANLIQSLDADGFTLGSDVKVNSSGVAYEWMAFRTQAGLLKVGSYGGNGTSQSVSGLGFSPEYAAVFSAINKDAVQRYSGTTTSYPFKDGNGDTQRITSLDAGGFTVGSNDTVNTSGATHHWIAFNDSAGVVDVSGYTGNDADNRNITGVGFQPAYAMIRADATGASKFGVHRPGTLPGDPALRYKNTANYANALQALQSDGFQVGSDRAVNEVGIAYRYLAVRDTANSAGTGCANPGSALVNPVADAYVDQNVPTTNLGTGNEIHVRTEAAKNKRALVRFNLPSIPSGCSLTTASLKLHATGASAGRTIDVYRAAASWTETGVTWNTRPGTTGTAVSSASGTNDRRWDVTTQVAAMYSGTNNGFVVRDQTEGGPGNAEQKYASRERTPDAEDPELRVIWR